MTDEHTLEPVPVNAGGRTMRGFLPGIRMEADPGHGGGAADPAAGDPDPGTPAEPAADPAVPATPAPVALDLNDPAVLEAIGELSQRQIEQQFAPLLPLLEQLAATNPGQPQQQGPQFELDPLGDDFGSQLAQMLAHERQQTLGAIRQELQAIQAPLAARAEAETVAEGEQRLKDILADDIARNGDFPRAPGQAASQAEALVLPLARALFPEIAGRFGQTQRAAELAMNQAAQTVRALIAEAQAAGATETTNRLATLANAGGEPGAAGAAAVETLPATPLSPREIALKYGGRAAALTRS